MNDVDFINRLEHELSSRHRWRDIEKVLSAQVDPSLAANELLVFPRQGQGDREAVEALRIVAEHLVLPGMPL